MKPDLWVSFCKFSFGWFYASMRGLHAKTIIGTQNQQSCACVCVRVRAVLVCVCVYIGSCGCITYVQLSVYVVVCVCVWDTYTLYRVFTILFELNGASQLNQPCAQHSFRAPSAPPASVCDRAQNVNSGSNVLFDFLLAPTTFEWGGSSDGVCRSFDFVSMSCRRRLSKSSSHLSTIFSMAVSSCSYAVVKCVMCMQVKYKRNATNVSAKM